MNNDATFALTTVACVALFVVIGIIVLIYSVYKNRREKRILEESIRLSALRSLNKSMGFRTVETLSIHRELPTLAQFERFDPDGFLLAAIGEDRGNYETWIKDAEYNYKLGLQYEGKLAGLPASQYDKQSWRNIEEELLDAYKLKFDNPPKLVLKWSYTSPAGRSHVFNYKEYTVEGVKKALLQSNDNQYDRTDRQASIARERALMTDSLRYDVLKRGDFKCAICGSTAADGVKLEVDHIIPVSKGGKTELSNLQVLCDRCNRGKRDKL